MTDLEISKALALAIGWKPEQMRSYPLSQTLYCPCAEAKGHDGPGIKFDHRDWGVIGPIAERYDCFPFQIRSKEEDFGKWNVIRCGENDIMDASPQRAIALAVIQGAKT